MNATHGPSAAFFNLPRHPHLWFSHGNWHCNLRGEEWPRGVGATPDEATMDWLHRLVVERRQ